MERRYNFYTFFSEIVVGYKLLDTTEAEIYISGDEVWKVFHSSVPIRRKHENHFDDLTALDPEMFTSPIDKLILDDEYYGFLMKYAGINLNDYLSKNKTTKKENVEILQRIKSIITCLKGKGIIHGDLRLPNILIDDEGIIRLTDLNNMIFPGDWPMALFLNRLHEGFIYNVGSPEYLDDLAFNLITYILINFSHEEFVDIMEDGDFVDYSKMCHLLVQDHGYFEHDKFEIIKDSLIGDKYAIKSLKKTPFLIDCLK